MCINKKTYKCCYCLRINLTTVTGILAFTYGVSGTLSGFNRDWINCVIKWILANLLITCVLKRHYVKIRKICFYVFYVLTVIYTIMILHNVIELTFFNDSFKQVLDKQLRNECTADIRLSDRYDSIDDCIDFGRTVDYLALWFGCFYGITCMICITRILYYGWKEQE